MLTKAINRALNIKVEPVTVLQSAVIMVANRAQQNFIDDLIKRRDTFNFREQTEESFENAQYYSFKEAAKAGCDLSALRLAVGIRNNIQQTLFTRLFNDTQLMSYDAVKNLKAQIDHEQDLIKQQACIDSLKAYGDVIEKISRLSFVFEYAQHEPETKAILTQLLDSGKLSAPVDIKQINAVKAAQEADVYNILTQFYNANGSSDDARLEGLIPVGTFFKLQSKRAVKNPVPVVVEDILDFNQIKF